MISYLKKKTQYQTSMQKVDKKMSSKSKGSAKIKLSNYLKQITKVHESLIIN
jgi:uncharacterized membrane protein YcgQ (UPF0703/DUF1980 family)